MRGITACARSRPIAATITGGDGSALGHPGHKVLVQPYVLGDFAKSEEPWVEDLTRAIADNAALLAKGDEASFQNKVHLAMEARGWTEVKRPGDKAAAGKE